jgi:hypothetical protein
LFKGDNIEADFLLTPPNNYYKKLAKGYYVTFLDFFVSSANHKLIMTEINLK